MEKAAGFIIFRKSGSFFEYLLLQASYGTHHWTPPKGHVETGESDLDTAYRETKEEAGYDKEDLKVFKDFKKMLKYSVNNSPKTVVYWLAELINNKSVVLSSEHQDYKWLQLEKAKDLSAYKDMQNLLTESEEYLKKHYTK